MDKLTYCTLRLSQARSISKFVKCNPRMIAYIFCAVAFPLLDVIDAYHKFVEMRQIQTQYRTSLRLEA